jgi:23S rRNA (guanine2445-N2)-methyltransferase / 23S rRNA (guanine2069-N7)-methyltransferase
MEREFDVQRDHARLLESAAMLLAPGGTMVFSNNFQKFRLDESVQHRFETVDLTRETLPEDFARNPKIHACFELRPRVDALAGT